MPSMNGFGPDCCSNDSEQTTGHTILDCEVEMSETATRKPVFIGQEPKKLGKKRAFMVCQGIAMIGYVLFWFLFVPGKPYLFLFALPFHSFGIGSLFTIMMSMTADVCDLDELNTGQRREGVLGAVYWWMVKLGFGLAALLSGAILSFVGFDAANVTESAVTGMRAFYSLLPIAGVIGALLIVRNYDITEERAAQLKEDLAQKRAELANAG